MRDNGRRRKKEIHVKHIRRLIYGLMVVRAQDLLIWLTRCVSHKSQLGTRARCIPPQMRASLCGKYMCYSTQSPKTTMHIAARDDMERAEKEG